jgi:hypothetical protein
VDARHSYKLSPVKVPRNTLSLLHTKFLLVVTVNLLFNGVSYKAFLQKWEEFWRKELEFKDKEYEIKNSTKICLLWKYFYTGLKHVIISATYIVVHSMLYINALYIIKLSLLNFKIFKVF